MTVQELSEPEQNHILATSFGWSGSGEGGGWREDGGGRRVEGGAGPQEGELMQGRFILTGVNLTSSTHTGYKPRALPQPFCCVQQQQNLSGTSEDQGCPYLCLGWTNC